MLFKNIDGSYEESPVHYFFGLTRSSYFVMPRLALEALPFEWQKRFVALMDEANALGVETPEYVVCRRGVQGRFEIDPWSDYRHGCAHNLCSKFVDPEQASV